eukprot:gene20551-biopygen14635
MGQSWHLGPMAHTPIVGSHRSASLFSLQRRQARTEPCALVQGNAKCCMPTASHSPQCGGLQAEKQWNGCVG